MRRTQNFQLWRFSSTWEEDRRGFAHCLAPGFCPDAECQLGVTAIDAGSRLGAPLKSPTAKPALITLVAGRI